MSRNRSRTHVSTRPRATPLLKISLAPQGASTHVETNPWQATNRAVPERSRERVLSDAELAAIWQACGDDDYGRIVQLLILTGQRREEVGGMRWEEVDLVAPRWCIPSERTKNYRPHEIPLTAPALKIVRGLQRRPDRPFLFGEGQGPF